MTIVLASPLSAIVTVILIALIPLIGHVIAQRYYGSRVDP